VFHLDRPAARGLVTVVALVAAASLLAACGGGGRSYGSPPPTSTTLGTSLPAAASGTLSSAHVFGLGNVVVDGRGYTVYVLDSGGTNVACTGGCAAIWPPLVLGAGKQSVVVGKGLNAAMVSTTKVGASTVPTYNGWKLYEYVQDTGPAQASGQGVQSFGGTWYALGTNGSPVGAGNTPAAGY
jgi:predicted lipoprotein with Yx(FWY)xxD motif